MEEAHQHELNHVKEEMTANSLAVKMETAELVDGLRQELAKAAEKEEQMLQLARGGQAQAAKEAARHQATIKETETKLAESQTQLLRTQSELEVVKAAVSESSIRQRREEAQAIEERLQGQVERKERELEMMREAWRVEKAQIAHEEEAFPVMAGELKRMANENQKMKQEAEAWTAERAALLVDVKKEKERVYTKSMEATKMMKEANAFHAKGLVAQEEAKRTDIGTMARQLNDLVNWNETLRGEVEEGREAVGQRDRREFPFCTVYCCVMSASCSSPVELELITASFPRTATRHAAGAWLV